MTTTHLDRKDLKRPDAFVAQTGSFFHFVSDNIRAILFVGAILFLMVLAVVGYSTFARDREEKASGASFEVWQNLNASLAKLPKEEAAWESKIQTEVAAVEKTAAEFPGTVASFQANFGLGRLFLDRGDAQKAQKYFEQAVVQARKDELRAAALVMKAAVQETLKDFKGAQETLQQSMKYKDLPIYQEAVASSERVGRALKQTSPK